MALHDLPRGRILSAGDLVRLGARFYHVSLAALAAGTPIRSRDYLRRPHYNFFRHPPPEEFLQDPNFRSYRHLEATFEALRREVAPQAPSRESALFCFTCDQCAAWFRDRSRKGGVIVELKPTSTSIVFLTDLVWRNVASNVLRKSTWRESSFPFRVQSREHALERVAEAYWRGEDPRDYELDSRPEALIEGEALVREPARH